MVLEAVMISTLAGMGLYFVKSTDLPKDMKAKSSTNSAVSKNSNNFKAKFNTENKTLTQLKSPRIQVAIDESHQLEKLKKEKKLKLIESEINELTLKITTLEQEIKENNDLNAKLLSEIDAYLARLEVLSLERQA